jgi:hypothetical protein
MVLAAMALVAGATGGYPDQIRPIRHNRKARLSRVQKCRLTATVYLGDLSCATCPTKAVHMQDD